MTRLSLDAEDALELGEFLEFVHDWVDSAPDIAASLARFVGSDGYGLEDLRADLARFAFLVGGDGERSFRTTP